MKKSLRALVAGVAALGLALTPAMTAQAATTQTGTITQTWSYQYASAVSPDGNIQVVLNYDYDLVYFVYQDTDTVVQIADMGTIDGPISAAFSPDGSKVFVSNYNSDITVIGVAQEAISDTITTPNSENLAIGVSPDGTRLVLTDDYADVTVYDLTDPSYPQVGSNQDITGDSIGVYFVSNSVAYTVSDSGEFDVVDLTTGLVTDSYGGIPVDAYGTCAPSDLSTVVLVDGTSVEFLDPLTGDSQGNADLSTVAGTSDLTLCTFTPAGYILVTDWGSSSAQIYIVDSKTQKYIETVALHFDGPSYTPSNAVNLMTGCEVFVAGYDWNVAVVQLDDLYCNPPSDPELPNTGVDTTVMTIAAATGFGVIALGALALVVARRRATR